jgi:multiple sugar transport system substrate-binding protein
MKKILMWSSMLVLIISMVAAFSFIGCKTTATTETTVAAETTAANETTAAGEKTKINFWYFHSGAEGDFMAALADKYNKANPNVEVVATSIPQADYMGVALTTAFAGDAGPDVFFMSPGDFLKYANSNLAMDLSPYFTDEIKADFLQSSLDAVTVNGKIVGVPFEIELLGLYYNIDMLAAANVQPPKTWDELIEATRTLTKDQVAGLLVEPNKGYYQNFTWYPFLWQGDGNVVDVPTKEGTFEGPAVENALKLWGDLVKAGAPSKITIPGTWDISLLGQGNVAMQICGTWAVAVIESTYTDTNIGLVPLPIPDGGKAATDAGGWKLMVNANSKNADAAAKFVMWAFAENIDLPLEWCTVTKFAYSPRKSVVEAGKDIYSVGLRKVFTDEIYGTAIGEPRYPAEIVNAVGDALQEVMFANADPKDAAQKATDIIKEFLKSFNGSM